MKQFIEAEQEPEDDFSFPVIGELVRTVDGVIESASKLNLDSDKMNASLFWFYNGNQITDEAAFEALKNNDLDKAISIWIKLTSTLEITQKNASAFHNLATLYLNQSTNNDMLEQGLSLKLKFLESEFVRDLKNLATDETYKITKIELQFLFLHQIHIELEKNTIISANKFLDILSKQQFSGKENFFKSFIQKPIQEIEKQIQEAKIKRKNIKENALKIGQELYEQTSENLNQLKSILGVANFQYSLIVDNVVKEILQCIINFVNHCQENESDYFEPAYGLIKLTEQMAVSKSTKDEVKDNLNTLEKMKETSLCWYCKKNVANNKFVHSFLIYKETNRTYFPTKRVEFKHTTISVPRCKNCNEIHSQGDLQLLRLMFVPYVISFIIHITITWSDWSHLIGCILGFIVFGWIPTAIIYFIVSRLMSLINARKHNILRKHDINDFPVVKRLSNDGWTTTEPSA